jgi:hypothetical protein
LTALLAWLRTAAARRDRILADALNMGTVLSVDPIPEGWRVRVKSKRGIEHSVVVVAHPVMGTPMRYYRDA